MNSRGNSAVKSTALNTPPLNGLSLEVKRLYQGKDNSVPMLFLMHFP